MPYFINLMNIIAHIRCIRYAVVPSQLFVRSTYARRLYGFQLKEFNLLYFVTGARRSNRSTYLYRLQLKIVFVVPGSPIVVRFFNSFDETKRAGSNGMCTQKIITFELSRISLLPFEILFIFVAVVMLTIISVGCIAQYIRST